MKRAREFDFDQQQQQKRTKFSHRPVEEEGDEKEEWSAIFKITKVASFLKVFELVKKLVNECKLSFSSDKGMTILEGDTNKVALMNVVLRPNFFSNFECKTKVNFCVSLHIFHEAVKSMHQSNTGDAIDVKLNEFVMELSSENKAFGETLNFRLLAIEKPDVEQLKPGKNEYSFYATIPAKRLVNVCQTLKNLNSDRITFESHGNDYYEISGHSDLVERYRCRLETDQGMMIGVENKKEIKQSVTIPLFYVQTVAQAHKLNERVGLMFGPNLPFVLRYTIYAGVKEDEASTFTVWIATCLDPDH